MSRKTKEQPSRYVKIESPKKQAEALGKMFNAPSLDLSVPATPVKK